MGIPPTLQKRKLRQERLQNWPTFPDLVEPLARFSTLGSEDSALVPPALWAAGLFRHPSHHLTLTSLCSEAGGHGGPQLPGLAGLEGHSTSSQLRPALPAAPAGNCKGAASGTASCGWVTMDRLRDSLGLTFPTWGARREGRPGTLATWQPQLPCPLPRRSHCSHSGATAYSRQDWPTPLPFCFVLYSSWKNHI